MSVALNGKIRIEKGKSATRKIRQDAYLPAVLYGLDDNVLLMVRPRELKQIIQQEGANALIDLSIEGDSKTKRQVILKDYQTHPLREAWVHVDFLELDMSKKTKTRVPVKLMGQSPGEKAGGLVNHVAKTIEIECLPGDIPKVIELDMTEVELGQVLHISDLIVADQIQILHRPEDPVVSVYLEKVKEEKPEEEEEAVEGEAAEAEGAEKAEEAPAKEESPDKK